MPTHDTRDGQAKRACIRCPRMIRVTGRPNARASSPCTSAEPQYLWKISGIPNPTCNPIFRYIPGNFGMVGRYVWIICWVSDNSMNFCNLQTWVTHTEIVQVAAAPKCTIYRTHQRHTWTVSKRLDAVSYPGAGVHAGLSSWVGGGDLRIFPFPYRAK